MPDICMCKGSIGATDCPFKEKCYRYTAKADLYQSYFIKLPLINGKCDFYWSMDGEIFEISTEHFDSDSYRIEKGD